LVEKTQRKIQRNQKKLEKKKVDAEEHVGNPNALEKERETNSNNRTGKSNKTKTKKEQDSVGGGGVWGSVWIKRPKVIFRGGAGNSKQKRRREKATDNLLKERTTASKKSGTLPEASPIGDLSKRREGGLLIGRYGKNNLFKGKTRGQGELV